ncbi:hypothetical protein OB955_08060 [Halobacteria archaeon AArc-m2/3/4]|uniref:Uncharacterized protein n=1 Tax=Natronoglomus mannanivorans TaxID=2979990 RepID=A0AAP3E185_9EURY|nr:hypothetical protein [Halobacteria archaeon AArc-xg1-1]MCU4972691.1 hypothetical protein [Halobacteria archaeon AArc-m2/3/4]
MAQSDTAGQQLLSRLEGRKCEFCSDGTLVRGIFKGNAAVICEECDTPAAQSW